MRLVFASVRFLSCGLAVWPTGDFAAAQRGSTWMLRAAVPEYACFSLAGGVLPCRIAQAAAGNRAANCDWRSRYG